MKVLVTGGTGVVGIAAVRALLADGHSVRLFSRRADHTCSPCDQNFHRWTPSRRGGRGEKCRSTEWAA